MSASTLLGSNTRATSNVLLYYLRLLPRKLELRHSAFFCLIFWFQRWRSDYIRYILQRFLVVRSTITDLCVTVPVLTALFTPWIRGYVSLSVVRQFELSLPSVLFFSIFVSMIGNGVHELVSREILS